MTWSKSCILSSLSSSHSYYRPVLFGYRWLLSLWLSFPWRGLLTIYSWNTSWVSLPKQPTFSCSSCLGICNKRIICASDFDGYSFSCWRLLLLRVLLLFLPSSCSLMSIFLGQRTQVYFHAWRSFLAVFVVASFFSFSVSINIFLLFKMIIAYTIFIMIYSVRLSFSFSCFVLFCVDVKFYSRFFLLMLLSSRYCLFFLETELTWVKIRSREEVIFPGSVWWWKRWWWGVKSVWISLRASCPNMKCSLQRRCFILQNRRMKSNSFLFFNSTVETPFLHFNCIEHWFMGWKLCVRERVRERNAFVVLHSFLEMKLL